MLEEAIKAIEQEVENKQRRIDTLRQRIEKLQARGEPNTALIAELSGDVQELETDWSPIGLSSRHSRRNSRHRAALTNLRDRFADDLLRPVEGSFSGAPNGR